jgi:lipid A 3-O-deacylase
MPRGGRTSVVAAVLTALLPTVVAAETAENTYARWGDLAVLGDNAPHYLDLAVGVFDLRQSFGTSERSAAGRVELRGGRKLWFLGPAMGLMANTDGGVFGYGGVYADIAYGNVIVTPFGGFGGYRRDDSSGLGGVFQFRLSLGVSYVFPNRHRLGLNFAHISNAAIHDKNPGEEELYITYAIPF